MSLINTYLFLMAAHWFADFFLQSEWMAVNKSKNLLALFAHVDVYIATLFIFVGCFTKWNSSYAICAFCLINFIGHFVTDFFTSRLTSKLWASKEMHWFFVVIGFDQLIHAAFLFNTWDYFFRY